MSEKAKKADYNRAFAEGKRAGRLDKKLGLCWETALDCGWAGYGEGYRAGVEEVVREQ
jgi:hypothetical protein